MPDIKIFVADDVNEGGLEPLRAAGFDVEKRTGLRGEELAEALRGADGLVVRSETKVTAKLLESLARLRVIGRAGVPKRDAEATSSETLSDIEESEKVRGGSAGGAESSSLETSSPKPDAGGEGRADGSDTGGPM